MVSRSATGATDHEVAAVARVQELEEIARTEHARVLELEAQLAERTRYVLQYRDASGFEWVQLGEGFDRRGDVLAARDEALADEQDGLPKGRHRAVDMETGSVIEWQHEDQAD